jgi:hypothetical protein
MQTGRWARRSTTIRLLLAGSRCPLSSSAQAVPVRERAPRSTRQSSTYARGGGEPNVVAMTTAVVGIQNAHFGRGPKTATMFHQNNMIVTVVREVMTHLDRALGRSENGHAVRHVIAFVSGTNFDPDMASELVMRDSEVYPTAPGPAAPPQPTRTVAGYAALRAGSFGTRLCADTHPRIHGPAKPLGRRIPAARVGCRWRRGGERCS